MQELRQPLPCLPRPLRIRNSGKTGAEAVAGGKRKASEQGSVELLQGQEVQEVNMLEHYRTIDVEALLRDYKDNKKKLAELKREKAYLLGAAGVDTTKEAVRGLPSSPTENTAIARERLDRKIAALEEYFRAFDAAMDYLDETDRAIIKEYYVENHPTVLAATIQLQRLGYSERAIRAKKEKAIMRLHRFFN